MPKVVSFKMGVFQNKQNVKRKPHLIMLNAKFTVHFEQESGLQEKMKITK